MKTIQEKYNGYLAGQVTREKLLYEVRRDEKLKDYISGLMSFDDTIKTLKYRGILTEAKKSVDALTLDTANPYEVRKGVDIELKLLYKASPVLPKDEYIKIQNKVLKNLAKDPNFYSKTYGGQKPTTKPDLASDADFGNESKRSDVSVPVKKDNFVDKKNAVTSAKLEKSNVKDTLGNKEKSKSKNAKGVKVMTNIPKKAKGVKVMNMPGKEKRIKLSELFENIPAANTDMLPFGNVKPGMAAADDSGERFKIVAMGDYNAVKRYDQNRTFDKFLSSDPTGIDATQLVALIDQDGNTFVRVYGTGGVYAYKNKEAGATLPEDIASDIKNKKRDLYNLQIRQNQDDLSKLNKLTEADSEFEAEIQNKELPPDELELSEAKAAVLPTLTKANLHRNLNIDEDVAVKNGNIWVKIRLGSGILTKDTLKALTGDAKFKAINPNTDSEVTLIFSKA